MVYKFETSLQHIRHVIDRYQRYYKRHLDDPDVFSDILDHMQGDVKRFDAIMGVMAIDFFTCEFKFFNGKFEDVPEDDVLFYGLVHDMDLGEFEQEILDDPSILEELFDYTSEMLEYPVEGRYELGEEILAAGYESIYTRFHPFYELDKVFYEVNYPKSVGEIMEEEFYDDYLFYNKELKDYFKSCDALAYNLATGTTFPLTNDDFWHRFIEKYYRFAKGMDHFLPETIDPINRKIMEKIESSSHYDEVRDFLVHDTDLLSEAVNLYVQSLDLSFDPIQIEINSYDQESGMTKVFTRYHKNKKD